MDKNKINDYLEKLRDLEKQIESDSENNEENIDTQIEKIINSTKMVHDLEKDLKNEINEPNNSLNVNYLLLDPNAVEPSYAKNGDAGCDLTVTSIIEETDDKIKYGYGLSVEIPEGYVGLVFPRSSISLFDLLMTNSVGVIDSGYRGEIMSVFYKTDISKRYDIGDRAAQIIILPYPKIKWNKKEKLSKTERNNGGYGHTNVS